MKRIPLLVLILTAAAWSSTPDSSEAAAVADTVFFAMQEADGETIAAHLSESALLEVDEILLNLQMNPDLTLAMLSFNWGVETVPVNYEEWNRGDLLSLIYSSPMSQSILMDTDNTMSGVELSGSTATVTWILKGEEWPMMLVVENGVWKVSDLEDF